MNWIGIFLLLLVGYQLYKGRISGSNDTGSSYVIRRSEKPLYFWLIIFVEVLLAGLFIFGVFHF